MIPHFRIRQTCARERAAASRIIPTGTQSFTVRAPLGRVAGAGLLADMTETHAVHRHRYVALRVHDAQKPERFFRVRGRAADADRPALHIRRRRTQRGKWSNRTALHPAHESGSRRAHADAAPACCSRRARSRNSERESPASHRACPTVRAAKRPSTCPSFPCTPRAQAARLRCAPRLHTR